MGCSTGPVVVNVGGVTSNDTVIFTRTREYTHEFVAAQGSTNDDTNCHAEVASSVNGDGFVVYNNYLDNVDDPLYPGNLITLTTIYARRYDAVTGTWDDPIQISKYVDDDSSGRVDNVCRPRITMDADGNALCVYISDTRSVNASVYYNRYNAETKTWGEAQPITTETDKTCFAEIGSDANGNAIVMYKICDQDKVVAAHAPVAGGAFTTYTIFEDPGNDPGSPHLSVGPNGQAAMVVIDYNDYVIRGNYFNGTAWVEDPSALPNLTDMDDIDCAGHCHVSVNSEGKATAAFVVNILSTGYKTIYANHFDGTSWLASPVPIQKALDPGHPRVAMDDNGNAVCAYVMPSSGDSYRQVYAARYVASEGKWLTGQQISSITSSTACGHEISSFDADGNVIVALKQRDEPDIYADSYKGRIYSVMFNGSTNQWETPVVIDNGVGTPDVYYPYLYCRPRVAMDRTGNATFGFVRFNYDPTTGISITTSVGVNRYE